MRNRALSSGFLLAAFLSLAVWLVSGCAAGRPQEESGYAVDDTSLDSFALIDKAMNTGRLDYSTGTLYKVYAAYEPLSLPEDYRSDVPLTGVSALVSEVERNWNRLTEEHRGEIAAYIQPVSEPDEHDTGLDDVTPDRLEHERNRLD